MIYIIAYMAVIALVVLVFVVAISILIHELPTILRDIESIKEILDVIRMQSKSQRKKVGLNEQHKKTI